MKANGHDLVLVSTNRLFADAAGAALITQGAVTSYIHVREGGEDDFFASVPEEPPVLLLDVTSHLDPTELFSRIRRLAQQLPTTRIVAIGDDQSAECVAGCIESGASTFVLVGDSLAELAATVRAMRGGQSRCSGKVIEVVLQRIRELSSAKSAEPAEDDLTLTRREIEVLKLVEQGLLNKEIARQLGISVSTVKNHLHAIFEKLHVVGRRQAVRQGIAAGILRCSPQQSVA